MRPTTIPPLFSVALTLLAAAACGYLNKDRLNTKTNKPATEGVNEFHVSRPPATRNIHLDVSGFNLFTNYQPKKSGLHNESAKTAR